MRDMRTVNMFGQYVLSDPFVVFAAPCLLAEQMYHYIRVAKNILP